MQLKRARLQQKFGEAASDYDFCAQFQHLQTRRVLDAALMLFPHTATLLDVGCGTAYFAHEAKQQRPDWRIIGVDIAQGMCAVANTRCAAINGDAMHLPLADASVDAVVSSLCYQWVVHQAPAFSELARVMKPQGRAIIASLGARTLQELRECAKATGLPLGLLPMQPFETTLNALSDAGVTVTMQEQRLETRYYSNVNALLDSMRRIGAGNHMAVSARGLTSPKRWAAMVKSYETLRTPEGIPATWEHHFFVLSKRA